MRHHFADLRQGFDLSADAVVVGSGAGGAVVAANLAASGRKVVVLEAGPEVRPEEMTRDAPRFLARYYWEGGLRALGGSAQIPSMQGRCLGGSTVVNSAIMLKLPGWVREEWAAENHLDFLRGPALDRAYERIFARCSVTPTPLTVLGRRNELARDVMDAAGLESGPLPRAVKDCDGAADCITGCATGKKQSMDRTYLVDAERDGAEIYTSAQAERILVENGRAAGVTGRVVDPRTQKPSASFTVRAPLVFASAGAAQTPVLLLRSGIRAGGAVGGTFYAHLGAGMVGIMEEVVDPWIGAAQGWGAFSPDIRGMKFECLWAAPSLLMVRWGDVGARFVERLGDIRHATVLAVVYRGKVRGKVGVRFDGMPSIKLHIPDEEAQVVGRGMKRLADALLQIGARSVYTGIFGVKDDMRTLADTEELLSKKIRARDLPMTANHIFGSCPMSGDPSRGATDPRGKVRGLEGLYIADASLFPSPSAVNPQATIMGLSDIVSRQVAELPV